MGQYERGRNACLLAFERLDSSATLQADMMDFLKQLFNLLWNAALKAEELATPDPELCLDMKRVALLAATRADLQLDFVLPRLLKADTKFHKATSDVTVPSLLDVRHRFHSLLINRLAPAESLQGRLPCKTLALYVEALVRFSMVSCMCGSTKDCEGMMKRAKSILQSHRKGLGSSCPDSLHCCLPAAATVFTTELVVSLLRHPGNASHVRCPTHTLQDLCSAVQQVMSLDIKMADLDAIGRLSDSIDILFSALEQQRQRAGGWREARDLPLTRTNFDLLRTLFGFYPRLRRRILAGAQTVKGGGRGHAEGAEAAIKCKHLYLLNILQEMLVDLLVSTNDNCIEGDGKEEDKDDQEIGDEEEDDIELPRSASTHAPLDPKVGVAALCLPLLEESREILRGEGCGLPEEEHCWLGRSAYNMAVTLHRCGMCGEAVCVLELACSEMGVWCGSKEGRMVEVRMGWREGREVRDGGKGEWR